MGFYNIRFSAAIYYNNNNKNIYYLYHTRRIRVSFRTVKFQISIVFYSYIFTVFNRRTQDILHPVTAAEDHYKCI